VASDGYAPADVKRGKRRPGALLSSPVRPFSLASEPRTTRWSSPKKLLDLYPKRMKAAERNLAAVLSGDWSNLRGGCRPAHCESAVDLLRCKGYSPTDNTISPLRQGKIEDMTA
jgi:hypothetical protein